MPGSFSRVLEELGGAEEDGDKNLSEPHFRVSARAGLTVTELGPQTRTRPQQKTGRYEIMPEEPQVPPQLSLSELTSQIGKAASMEELCHLRRQFARVSHPDHHEDPSATSEMAAANRLIDDAIASLRERH
ncbi:MAG: hypothetical protein ACLPX9_14920 [Rhodomicrobium sp.]